MVWTQEYPFSSSYVVIVWVRVVLKRTVIVVFRSFQCLFQSFVKLLSRIEADRTVEAILFLMLSLADSDNSRWRDRTANTIKAKLTNHV